MQHFFDWFSQHIRPEQPWLILGKGPSFALRSGHDLSEYHLLSLNHAVREQSVLVAHLIDLDVVEACSDVLERHARFLVMPWYPHVEHRPSALPLDELVPNVPLLRRLAEAGRLLWYDLSTSPIRHGPAPVVQATYFSAEAGLNLLALAGAHSVRTLGVDGGTDYSGDFDDLKEKTLLANGRTSFDLQFEGFARTILDTGIDVAPLDVPSPVRICVAHAPTETLPVAVLRHSIRRTASLSVQFVALPTDALPFVGEDGPALVLSPRVQCVADVRPFSMCQVGEREVIIPAPSPQRADDGIALALAGRGISTELAHLATLLRAGVSAASLRVAVRAPVQARLRPVWNPDAQYQPGQSRFVHYPQNGSEPWLSRAHPLGHMWVRDLLDGMARGFITADLVASEIRRGHVRPSLGYQVEHRVEEPLLLPRTARLLDRGFRPPEGEPGSRRGMVTTSVALLQALARQVERSARQYRARSGARAAAADR